MRLQRSAKEVSTNSIECLIPEITPEPEKREIGWQVWQEHELQGGPVMKYIWKHNDTNVPSEELFHDTVSAAFMEIESGERFSYRGPRAFYGYVYRIADNRIARARELDRKLRSQEEFDEEMPSAIDETNPELLFEVKEAHQQLREVVKQLSQKLREVIELDLQGGKSDQEIAEELGITEDNVRQRRSRGRRQIQALLGGGAPDTLC